ncbi:MAG: hypothetical protein KIT25_06615 [Enhydrobacter sp.]|nr:MAG: hypothetical protein KIT25_06615 [Enhydrobacter sp.]
MPAMFTLDHDREAGLLLVRFTGTLTVDIHRAMVAAVQRFVAANGLVDAIVDFSAVETHALDLAYLKTVASERAVLHGRKRVFVAPQDLAFGTSRLFEMHQAATGDRPFVVRTMAEALEIVGVPAPRYERIDPS